MRTKARLGCGLLAAMAAAMAQQPAVEGGAVFGTTVVIPAGLKGDIYYLDDSTTTLANLRKRKLVGSIYTLSLNVPPQDFSIGFPGLTERFEWFAIDYTGKFWIENPGTYRFRLISDDGAMLYIDGQLVADNDGVHSPEVRRGSVYLAGGIHSLRVPYFQGPRDTVALMLEVAGPGESKARIFNIDDFKPPSDPEKWRFGAAAAAAPDAAEEADLDRRIPARLAASMTSQEDGKNKKNRRRR